VVGPRRAGQTSLSRLLGWLGLFGRRASQAHLVVRPIWIVRPVRPVRVIGLVRLVQVVGPAHATPLGHLARPTSMGCRAYSTFWGHRARQHILFVWSVLVIEPTRPVWIIEPAPPVWVVRLARPVWVIGRDGNGAGRGRVSLSHTHPCRKKLILIPIPKSNRYQTFVPFSSSPSNGYNLVLIPVPIFLLLQY